MGSVSKVVPIDKLSVVSIAIGRAFAIEPWLKEPLGYLSIIHFVLFTL